MAAVATLATVAELATLLKVTIANNDPYALMMLGQASSAVRDAAGQAGWVRLEDIEVDEPGVGQTVAPEAAHDVTLWVASRAYGDPRNRSRKTAGPISESFFENGVYGLDLTEGERARLGGYTGKTSSGIWVLPMSYGEEVKPVLVPHELGYWYIADEDQFPYGIPD